ncbi:hypothetical protein NFI96_019400 [Prochilodus magdalenae]|nr:hypothetical protein NFI96_019400 [Prochilodus magdalenae]
MMRRLMAGRLRQAGPTLLGQNTSGRWGCGGLRMVHHCSALVYREHTANVDAVRIEQLPLPVLSKRSVRVKMLAAPVNPADLNMVQGTYPILCPLPAVGGNEGVGEVLDVGDDVLMVRPGDWVVPVDAGFGEEMGGRDDIITDMQCTWRTEAVCEEDDLISVPRNISLLSAATIAVNPCTAYRMLHDFQALTPGSTVIQNGANSAVGQAVIQIAAAMGIRTINIIRDRTLHIIRDRNTIVQSEHSTSSVTGTLSSNQNTPHHQRQEHYRPIRTLHIIRDRDMYTVLQSEHSTSLETGTLSSNQNTPHYQRQEHYHPIRTLHIIRDRYTILQSEHSTSSETGTLSSNQNTPHHQEQVHYPPIRTLYIIRDRPNCGELVKELQSLGADYVLTEEEVMSLGLQHVFQEVPKPKLGLNCVGGISGGLLLSNLDYGGTLVTYGGMAKRPLHIPAKHLIFKNITLQGFWMTQWKRNHMQDRARLRSMLDAVCELVRLGHLTPPNCVQTPFPQYSRALHATLQPLQRKHVLIM